MCTDPQRAVYGYKHVIYAREQQSIETLMVWFLFKKLIFGGF